MTVNETIALPTLPRGNCFERRCPGRAVLAHVTGRWGTLVMAALKVDGTLRFSQLRARIGGISEKMLAQTLRELEGDGLVRRISLPVVPPHVEYDLTPMGIGVAQHLEALIDWIETHVADFPAGTGAAP
jgi:DNA-binding HxlR family transcriptional regulator